jgi:hypothetical protein
MTTDQALTNIERIMDELFHELESLPRTPAGLTDKRKRAFAAMLTLTVELNGGAK